ncbi:MAG: RMD1 family protein [Gammaproteobacteria bacterium]
MSSQKRSFMRCVSFCTAGSYDLKGLANSFKRKGYLTRLSRDVLHVASTKKSADIFFFSHGSFVCWGFNKRQEQKWIEYVKDYANDLLTTIESDYFCYRLGEETSLDTHDRFKIDIITLDSDNPQIKLAMSYGLAQAIKLEAFEDAIQETVKKNGYLPEEIAHRGATSLSQQALFMRMGEIFIARSSINLNSEYLDTPEFFWRNPNFESFYVMTKKFLDIPSRVMALNQKLDVLQELLDILNSQVQHRHSSMLETIIILLILIEIIISIFQFHIW